MVVVRCHLCGEDLDTLEDSNTSEYRETLSEKPCQKCEVYLKTPEGSLLSAILGSRR